MIKNKQTKTSTPDDGQEEAKEDDQLLSWFVFFLFVFKSLPQTNKENQTHLMMARRKPKKMTSC